MTSNLDTAFQIYKQISIKKDFLYQYFISKAINKEEDKGSSTEKAKTYFISFMYQYYVSLSQTSPTQQMIKTYRFTN